MYQWVFANSIFLRTMFLLQRSIPYDGFDVHLQNLSSGKPVLKLQVLFYMTSENYRHSLVSLTVVFFLHPIHNEVGINSSENPKRSLKS